MNKKLGEGLIFTISNYLWWFILGNFYFILLNLPMTILMFCLLTGIISSPTPWLVALCSIPMGPALTALLGAMGKLLREKDVNITHDFFKAYKNSFKQSIFLWTIEVVALLAIYVDIQYILLARQHIFVYFFYGLAFYILQVGMYALCIISRFYLKTSVIFRISCGYTLRHFKTPIMNLCLFITVGFIFYNQPALSILFLMSLFCYCLMYSNNKILNNIEEEFLRL
ncbi:DUF624 domain-containing protein [Clostridium sp. CF012]|uniref:DUF624 domain-containing protein n=1 Tax=Clostridium sp. CF012 TaxID=2843319 RepID=UPI001C0B65B1|nr:DUF624 domain-containing protein [Clostridium sp. CF012]MBU3144812.1 DUF624 domain-containing protein [Clostridium sp. CF012]